MITPHGPIEAGEIADDTIVDAQINSAAAIAGSKLDPVLTNGVIGVAAGYNVARGTVKLDGANPTPVLHGLATVVAHMANPRGTAAPDDPVQVTTDVSGTALNLYGWKHTSAATTTLVASDNTTVDIDWVAIGT